MHHKSETNGAAERIADASEHVRQSAAEHPLTTLMFVGAAAFAVGALWKAGRRSPSRLDRMRRQMPDLDTLASFHAVRDALKSAAGRRANRPYHPPEYRLSVGTYTPLDEESSDLKKLTRLRAARRD